MGEMCWCSGRAQIRVLSRDVWPRVAAVPPPPWIGTGSLDSTSNSPHDVTLAELTRLLLAVRPTISETSPVGSHDRGRLPVRVGVVVVAAPGCCGRSWRRSGAGCSSGGGSAPWASPAARPGRRADPGAVVERDALHRMLAALDDIISRSSHSPVPVQRRCSPSRRSPVARRKAAANHQRFPSCACGWTPPRDVSIRWFAPD